MYLRGIGTAAPPVAYKQSECWDALQQSPQFAELTTRSRAILRKVLLGKNGIVTRHLALDPLEEFFQWNADALHQRFLKHAPTLVTQAAERALKNAEISATEIDAVLISTCTGYLCPGLTSYVTESLGLRQNIFALDLVGQGCGAALPNLRAAENLIASGLNKKVLSICVEVCSAVFYLDNDPGVLISACLFGDGAGAVVLSGDAPSNQREVKFKSFHSMTSAANRDLLRFEQKNGMLRNILSPQVPPLAAAFAKKVLDESLKHSASEQAEISTWILHAGGRDVLMALQEKLKLSPEDTCWSATVLRDFGNLSSPFVLFVLEKALREKAPGGLWWMASFGAGFSSHGVLLEVQ
ncbi:MAG: 3-oxoacyl-[acyl-carrier-protein] synthase III C-terminal domain-containing protein [Verrucomicrobiota bacterium]